MSKKISSLSWIGLSLACLVVLVMAISCAIRSPSYDRDIPVLQGAPRIRILIEDAVPFVRLRLPAGARILDGRKVMFQAGKSTKFSITARRDSLALRLPEDPDAPRSGHNAVRCMRRLAIVPAHAEEFISVEGRAYRGSMLVEVHGDNLSLVNDVDLEDYLYGVVTSEMPESFNDHALYAQAVAARSYAMYYLRTRRSKPYTLRTDQSSQVYKGVPGETPKGRLAVYRTRGTILSYEWKLYPTYYHAICGGGTDEANIIFGDWDVMPLSGVPCEFCKDVRGYRWPKPVVIPMNNLVEKLRSIHQDITAPVRIEVLEKARHGHVSWIAVHYRGGMHAMRAETLRRLFGLRSSRFTIENATDRIILKGGGWGHGVGMCQWGAQGMASAGNHFISILNAYYPGSELVRLY